MNHIQTAFVRALVLATGFTLTHSYAQDGSFVVTERGADYNVLQKTVMENGTNHVHQYTELATGMNYTNSLGQWVESKEQITILPTGGAAAIQGRHQVYFPADIYNGVLEVVTPDGRHLKSRPLGVSYDDGSNNVFIAMLKDAQGWLTSSNQVTYRDAFTGFKADLICTYRRGGFECDLVFRQQPPTPDQYGLDNASSTIQLVTEFFNTQDPQEIPAQTDDSFGLQDSTLKFGKLIMTHGNAFAVQPTNSQQQFVGSCSTVYKHWLHIDGRTFLVEEVPLINLADDLNALPLTASLANPKSSIEHLASGHRLFPPSHNLVSDTNHLMIASVKMDKQPGVVLDYSEVVSDQTDFTFENGSTYLIDGQLNLDGTTTVEGGAVIKYDSHDQCGGVDPWTQGGPAINVFGDFVCNTDPYHPAVFTQDNDNSVGESIFPVATPFSGDGLFLNLDSAYCVGVHDLRIAYAATGLTVPCDHNDFIVLNCQFIQCNIGILNRFEDEDGFRIRFGQCFVWRLQSCNSFECYNL